MRKQKKKNKVAVTPERITPEEAHQKLDKEITPVLVGLFLLVVAGLIVVWLVNVFR